MPKATDLAFHWLLVLVGGILLLWLLWASLPGTRTPSVTAPPGGTPPGAAAEPEAEAAPAAVPLRTDPQANPPRTLDALIAQAKQNQGATTLVFDQATPARQNDAGQWVLEASDTKAYRIDLASWQNGEVVLLLNYPGLEAAATLPPIYFTGLDGTQQTISATAIEGAIRVETDQLPDSAGDYFFTVPHYNPLQRPRQRYAFRID